MTLDFRSPGAAITTVYKLKGSQYPGVPSILYFPCKQIASTPRLITAAMSGAV